MQLIKHYINVPWLVLNITIVSHFLTLFLLCTIYSNHRPMSLYSFFVPKQCICVKRHVLITVKYIYIVGGFLNGIDNNMKRISWLGWVFVYKYLL
jgi:hypothetical protein